jgi:hypothetical protein
MVVYIQKLICKQKILCLIFGRHEPPATPTRQGKYTGRGGLCIDRSKTGRSGCAVPAQLTHIASF